jgi:hypothetical protein
MNVRLIRLGAALRAGLLGAIAVLVVEIVSTRILGVDVNLSALIGALLLDQIGAGPWLLGAAVQIALGLIGGSVYAAIFEWITHHASWWIGLLIGFGHAAIAGLALGYLTLLRGPTRAFIPTGSFLIYHGTWAVVLVIVAHVGFGLVVGATYGQVRRPIAAWSGRWREV